MMMIIADVTIVHCETSPGVDLGPPTPWHFYVYGRDKPSFDDIEVQNCSAERRCRPIGREWRADVV